MKAICRLRSVLEGLLLAAAMKISGDAPQFADAKRGLYFPPPGESLEVQVRRNPTEVGLKTNFIVELKPHIRGRWALWRHGYTTWVNTDGDFYPGADKAWAWGAGAGSSRVMWNRNNGLVFAAFGADSRPSTNGIPHILEQSVVGPNPLLQADVAADVGGLAIRSEIRNQKWNPAVKRTTGIAASGITTNPRRRSIATLRTKTATTSGDCL